MTSENRPVILTVSEITQGIKLTLEGTFPRVWVKGEVSNPKLQTSGHFYFSLKDDIAQIPCVCFRGDLLKVGFVPKAGDQVLVRAEMSLYPPKGAYQLLVRELSHVGKGDQLLKLELLKQKLQKLGYFAQERKRPLPSFPKCIGVVTSQTGAVIQDILTVLGRRMSGFHLILNPVRVQGDGADIEIANAIRQFNEHKLADVLIVGRGGGSVEDLMPFNSEVVANAIFNSQIPVVSAVGHETDFTIADMVADLRAATPSAAAEIISHEQEEMLAKLNKLQKDISQAVHKDVKARLKDLYRHARHPIFTSSSYLIQSSQQRLDDVTEELDSSIKRKITGFSQDLARYKKSLEVVRPSNRIQDLKLQLVQYEKNLQLGLSRLIRIRKQQLLAKNDSLNAIIKQRYIMKKRAFTACQFASIIPNIVQKKLQEKKRKLENVVAQLDSLHPKKILAKGYSIIFSQKDGSVISSAASLQVEQPITIAFVDGQADAAITTIRVKNP
ncbi:MAG: exodeoxyribonuclease VII large subunit [Chlamydiales bacterium]|nr:exodeoxyribonuclease VII large subunit [Chlamydiales bacterium]